MSAAGLHRRQREPLPRVKPLAPLTALQVPVACSGSLFYRITDGYKACFAVSDVQANIQNTGTSAVRSVLGHFTYDQVRAFWTADPSPSFAEPSYPRSSVTGTSSTNG